MANRKKRLNQALDGFLGLEKETDQETFPEKEEQAKTESFTHTEIQPETKTLPQAVTQTNSQTFSQADTKAETKVFVNSSNVDPIADIKDLVKKGKKRKKLEDERQRQTYWLSLDEINMVNEIADLTGLTKYEVVGKAIHSLYIQLLNLKN